MNTNEDEGIEMLSITEIAIRASKRPKNPVILLHGIFGFDKIAGGLVKYWNDVDSHLNKNDLAKVHTTEQPLSCSPWFRAIKVVDQLDKLRKEEYDYNTRFNLVGHSMGGIDARIVRRLCPELVESVTTIATPHHGSPFATYSLDKFGPFLLPFFKLFKVDTEGVPFLSPESMKKFNEQMNDKEHDIPLYSYSACRPKSNLQLPLRLPHDVVFKEEGENDGLVSVKSAIYGIHCGTIEADHMEQIGFSLRKKEFNHHDFFEEVVENLAKNGH